MTLNDVSSSNKEVVIRLYEDFFNKGNHDLLSTLISPEIVLHPANQKGAVPFLTTARLLQSAFEGLHFTIGDIHAEGNLVIALWTMNGRHVGNFRGLEPTGKLVESEALIVAKLEEDRICEFWIQVSGLRNVPEPEEAE